LGATQAAGASTRTDSTTAHGRGTVITVKCGATRAMALTGNWDIVCCGHEHRLEIALIDHVRGGKTLLINPGTVGGIGAPATYVICDLATLSCISCEVSPQSEDPVLA
jgi:uncharacterized protein